jgi:transcription initiation factor TFIID subunit 15
MLMVLQSLGDSFNPSQPLDAEQFAFFKGVDNAAKGGQLSVDVTGGLPGGFYRVCTLASASNHQSVLMPVAQRGAQDDCSKFSVGQ